MLRRQDNLTNISDTGAVPEFENFEEAFERKLIALPEENRTPIQDALQEIADFKKQLDEEGLAELEQRKEEEKALMKDQWIALINASQMSVTEKQEAIRNINNADTALEMITDMFVTAEMKVEQKIAEELNRPSIANSLSRLRAEEELQEQEMTEEWKMKQVLKALGKAARE